MFEGFQERRINVGEVEINCMVGGSGPGLLLLHGFPQNLYMWAHVAPLLADEYTVVTARILRDFLGEAAAAGGGHRQGRGA